MAWKEAFEEPGGWSRLIHGFEEAGTLEEEVLAGEWVWEFVEVFGSWAPLKGLFWLPVLAGFLNAEGEVPELGMGEIDEGGAEAASRVVLVAVESACVLEAVCRGTLDLEMPHLKEDAIEAAQQLGGGRLTGEEVFCLGLQGAEGEGEEDFAKTVEPEGLIAGIAT
jgi:hypothetical protein